MTQTADVRLIKVFVVKFASQFLILDCVAQQENIHISQRATTRVTKTLFYDIATHSAQISWCDKNQTTQTAAVLNKYFQNINSPSPCYARSSNNDDETNIHSNVMRFISLFSSFRGEIKFPVIIILEKHRARDMTTGQQREACQPRKVSKKAGVRSENEYLNESSCTCGTCSRARFDEILCCVQKVLMLQSSSYACMQSLTELEIAHFFSLSLSRRLQLQAETSLVSHAQLWASAHTLDISKQYDQLLESLLLTWQKKKNVSPVHFPKHA